MIELITRRFRIEDGEDYLAMVSFIQSMDGYHGNMKVIKNQTEITAEFSKKVI